MKWLEGWMGGVAGGIGLLITFIFSLSSARTLDLTYVYDSYRGPGGILPVGEQWIRLLVGLPSITATLLFAGVLWGVWLDLNGNRTSGRVFLLACSALILLLPLFASSEQAMVSLLPTVPFAGLALVTGALACVRREPQHGAQS